MIIGHGDIASVLTDRGDRIYFASGVSNSRETRESEYQREIECLRTLLEGPSISPLSPPRNKHLVYFSSLCVFYSDTRYSIHKREMENLVKHWFNSWTILRVGNITWGTNPHTLINFIRDKIKKREPVIISDVYRYIVTKEEFLYWIDMIPDWNCEMNITGRRMKVIDIVKEFCYPWGKPEYKPSDPFGDAYEKEILSIYAGGERG